MAAINQSRQIPPLALKPPLPGTGRRVSREKVPLPSRGREPLERRSHHLPKGRTSSTRSRAFWLAVQGLPEQRPSPLGTGLPRRGLPGPPSPTPALVGISDSSGPPSPTSHCPVPPNKAESEEKNLDCPSRHRESLPTSGASCKPTGPPSAFPPARVTARVPAAAPPRSQEGWAPRSLS